MKPIQNTLPDQVKKVLGKKKKTHLFSGRLHNDPGNKCNFENKISSQLVKILRLTTNLQPLQQTDFFFQPQ